MKDNVKLKLTVQRIIYHAKLSIKNLDTQINAKLDFQEKKVEIKEDISL